jgi:hypothetical protein
MQRNARAVLGVGAIRRAECRADVEGVAWKPRIGGPERAATHVQNAAMIKEQCSIALKQMPHVGDVVFGMAGVVINSQTPSILSSFRCR